MTTRATSAPVAAEAAAAPEAVRHRRSGWRDPRLLIGLAILAGSVLLGVKVLAAADDTVGVWAAATDLAPGSRVSPADLTRVELRFTSPQDADRYLAAGGPLPADAVLGREVGAGELLPRAAMGDAQVLVHVPLAVEIDNVPTSLRVGSVVDVWVAATAAQTGERVPAARLVLDDVVVVEAPVTRDSLAPSGTRQVVVGVEESRSRALSVALGQAASGRVVLTGQG